MSQAVETLNLSFNPDIGYLQPAVCNEDVNYGDLLISDKLRDSKKGKSSKHILTLDEQRTLKNKIEKSKNFVGYQVNDPVLLDLPLKPPRGIEKETSAKRGQIFLIDSLDFRKHS